MRSGNIDGHRDMSLSFSKYTDINMERKGYVFFSYFGFSIQHCFQFLSNLKYAVTVRGEIHRVTAEDFIPVVVLLRPHHHGDLLIKGKYNEQTLQTICKHVMLFLFNKKYHIPV